jgi:hypothetical protein
MGAETPNHQGMLEAGPILASIQHSLHYEARSSNQRMKDLTVYPTLRPILTLSSGPLPWLSILAIVPGATIPPLKSRDSERATIDDGHLSAK